MPHHPTRSAMLLFIALLAIPAAARAQAGAGSAGFDPRAMRDSLAKVTDRRAIRAIEAQHAKSSTAAGAITAGFAALRIHELSRIRDDARSARTHFAEARRRDDRSAWALYGWALAVLPEVKADDDTGRFGFAGDDAMMTELGLDPRSRARRALERAVQLDPGLPEAAQLLARLAVETRDLDAAVQAKTVLTSIAASDNAAPADHLALARAAEAAGDLQTAATAARAAAAASSGADAATAHHLAARALLRLPGREREGAEEYFRGLENLDRERATLYFDELRGIATGSEMEELERLPLPRATEWIRTFWDMHAALSAVSTPRRLAEHYTRLAYAGKRFLRQQRHGAPSSNALLYKRPESPFDDRGVIYLRHGEPAAIITSMHLVNDNRVQTQSWVYPSLKGGPVMYHYTNGQTERGAGTNDWYLMYNLPCDYGFMLDRAAHDKRLSPLIHRCDVMATRAVSVMVRRDAYEGLASENAHAGFSKPLPATYDMYTFRNPNGTTDIVVALGVDAENLVAGTLPDGGRGYTANMSLIVVDTVARTVFRTDTILRAGDAVAARPGSVLRGDVYLNAKPGRGVVHRVSIIDANSPDRGQLYGGPINVPDYSEKRLMMSDVVLAVPDTTGSFRRGDVSLATVPWQSFERGAFRIFYELYNMTPGSTYTTELEVERVGGGIAGAVGGLLGRRPPVSLRFEDVAPTEGVVVQQVRDARADLDPGEYRLTVSVTDARGNRVTRERIVTVVKGGS